MSLYQRRQLRPRHHLLHLIQKHLTLALTTKLLKTRLGRQCLLPHRAQPLLIILSKQDAALALVQSLLKHVSGRRVIRIVSREEADRTAESEMPAQT